MLGVSAVKNLVSRKHLAGFCLPVLFVLSAVSLGCNGSSLDIADVRGTVTLDGSPVKVLSVAFVPQDGGRTSNGATDDQGKYRLIYSPQYAGALVGSHTVEVLVEGQLGQTLARSKTRSKLTKDFEVESRNNVIDLELRDFEVTQ